MTPKTEKPVEENKLNIGNELTIKIVATGSKGDGIGKFDNRTIIVPKTNVNEEVKVRVTNITKTAVFAELIND
jgi:predicted RNA-binding protein with TRAM domain